MCVLRAILGSSPMMTVRGRNVTGSPRPPQIVRHILHVTANANSPITPVTAVALCAPIRSANQPNQTNPIGPVPIQTDSTPRIRDRISGGAAR